MSINDAWFEEVLPPYYNRGLTLINLYALRIPVRLCSKALAIAPAEPILRQKYAHLKRVKKEINCDELLCNDFKLDDTCLLLLGENGVIPSVLKELIKEETFETPFLVPVPRYEPLTKEQWKEWNILWPTCYRRPAWQQVQFYNSHGVRSIIFSQLRRLLIQSSLFKDNIQTLGITCSPGCIISFGRHVAAEVFLTPENNKQHAHLLNHPLYDGHGPIVALAQLSRVILELRRDQCKNLLEEGGATSILEDSDIHSIIPTATKEDTFVHIISSSVVNRKKQRMTKEYIESNDVARHHYFDGLFLNQCSLLSSQYYATGSVVFCTAEPCIMCCMALIHNRVSLVVWPKGNENQHFGGFGGKLAFHTDERLNHRFHVLRINLNANESFC